MSTYSENLLSYYETNAYQNCTRKRTFNGQKMISQTKFSLTIYKTIDGIKTVVSIQNNTLM